MKKLIALALCLMMILGTAVCFGEAVSANKVKVSMYGYEITWTIPENYASETVELEDGTVSVIMTSADPEQPIFTAWMYMVDDEEVANASFNDLTAEQKEGFKAYFLEAYSNPTVVDDATGLGTEMFIVDENIEDSDYVDMYSMYKGTIFGLNIMYTDFRQVTDEDIEVGKKIFTDCTMEESIPAEVVSALEDVAAGIKVTFPEVEGYTVTRTEGLEENSFIVSMFTENMSNPQFITAFYANELIPVDKKLNDFSAEEKALFEAAMVEDFYNPSVTYAQTGEGTDIIIIMEQDAEDNYAELGTVYDGYVLCMSIYKLDGSPITEEEIQQGIQIWTDTTIETPDLLK